MVSVAEKCRPEPGGENPGPSLSVRVLYQLSYSSRVQCCYVILWFVSNYPSIVSYICGEGGTGTYINNFSTIPNGDQLFRNCKKK